MLKYKPFEMTCPICGTKFIPDKRKLRSMAVGRQKTCYCTKECYKEHCKQERSGVNNPHWKGGKIRSKDYNYIRKPGYHQSNNYVAEHRMIMEDFLGRKLTDAEVVHHKNGNKHDNRLENLELMTISEHMKMHTTDFHRERRVKNGNPSQESSTQETIPQACTNRA